MLSSAVRRKRDGKPKFPEPQLTQPRLHSVAVNMMKTAQSLAYATEPLSRGSLFTAHLKEPVQRSGSPVSRPIPNLTVQQRLNALQRLDNGVTQHLVAQQCSV